MSLIPTKAESTSVCFLGFLGEDGDGLDGGFSAFTTPSANELFQRP